jgi:biopolymer transport protein ExbD
MSFHKAKNNSAWRTSALDCFCLILLVTICAMGTSLSSEKIVLPPIDDSQDSISFDLERNRVVLSFGPDKMTVNNTPVPGKDFKEQLGKLPSIIREIKNQLPNALFYIAGDYNAPYGVARSINIILREEGVNEVRILGLRKSLEEDI